MYKSTLTTERGKKKDMTYLNNCDEISALNKCCFNVRNSDRDNAFD